MKELLGSLKGLTRTKKHERHTKKSLMPPQVPRVNFSFWCMCLTKPDLLYQRLGKRGSIAEIISGILLGKQENPSSCDRKIRRRSNKESIGQTKSRDERFSTSCKLEHLAAILEQNFSKSNERHVRVRQA